MLIRHADMTRLVTAAAGLAAGRGLASAISALWLVVVARHLSLVDFGDLGVLLATTGVLIPVSERGMQSALSMQVAEQGRIDRVNLLRVLQRRIPLAVLCAAINALLFLAVSHSRDWRLPVLAAGTILGTSMYGTVLAAYRSLGKVRLDAVNEVVSRGAVLGAGTLWLVNGGGVVAAVACYAMADVASAIVIGAVAWRRHVHREASRPIDLRWRATLPLAAIMVVLVIYYRVDTYLVGLLRGSEAAGLYAAAYRFLELASLLPLALGSIMLSRAARQTAVERLATMRSLAAVATVVAVPVTVAGVLLGGWMVRTVFGAGFTSAGTTTSLLMLGLLPTAFVSAALPIAMYGDARWVARLAAVTLAVNVIANLAVIPGLGGAGAAVVNTATQCVLAAGLYAIARRRATAAPVTEPAAR